MRRRRDERGAVAIFVAMVTLVLFGTAALSVDLGQGWTATHDVQKSADFSALAGGFGTNLPTPPTTAMCGGGANKLSGPQAVTSSQAVQDVVSYLNSNPYNFGTSAAALTDCSMTNGEVIFGRATKGANNTWTETYSSKQLTVVTPPQNVGFGFARVIGYNSVNVVETATVSIFSQTLNRTLPYYSALGCSYGTQTIAQPSNGTSASSINLANNSDNGAQTITSVVTTPASDPATVDYPVTSPTPIVINGTGFTGVTQVGFFESGATSAGPAPTILAVQSGWLTGSTKISIPDISSLNLAQDTWYIRVRTSASAQWSAVSVGNGNNTTLNALPLTVGAPNLYCSEGSSQGNFGSLLLPNSMGPNGQTDNIAYNIAAGLEHTLATFPTPGTPSSYQCAQATAGAVLWNNDGTNCVDTKTGNVAADAAFEGLLTGVYGKPGLLTIQNGSPNTGCAANGTPASTVWRTFNINNDTLSCFFSSATTTVGDVDAPTYNLSGPAFDVSIYTSPRFVYVPVLGVTPDTGGSNKYQIIDFRPAFISDQSASATKATPEAACTTSQCNGLTVGSNPNTLNSLQVILLNPSSLPQCPQSICSGQQAYNGNVTTKQGPFLIN